MCCGLFIIVLAAISCSSTNSKPSISFSADSNSIIINHIDASSILRLKKAYKAHPDTINFISVLVTPTEEDGLQKEEKINGNVKFLSHGLIFYPLKPFEKGKSYLIENYIDTKFADTEKLLKGSIKHKLEPQQQILER